MDKNELSLKMEELKTAMHNRDFEKAVDIADTLELKKIKDNNFLSLVADAYELTHKYKEAKKVLLLAYENTNAGRHLAYRLCLIAIKNKEYDEAKEFYEDFLELAPRDTSRYILKYKMAKAQGKPLDQLIEILEEYVNIDMEEKWAYELAKLYHMAGEEEKCVDMCDEISLWFSEGKYVVKAMDLKRMYCPLTSTQQQKYDENKKRSVEEAARLEAEKLEKSSKNVTEKEEIPEDILKEDTPISENQEAVDIEIKPIEETFNTVDIQAVIANGMKDVEIKEGEDIHEGAGATKVAPDIKANQKPEDADKASDNAEKAMPVADLEMPEETALEELEELEEIEELEELEELGKMEEIEEPEKIEEPKISEKAEDSTINAEPIKDIKGVEDILRQLQERGILKAETVKQAVEIIGETEKEIPTKDDNISTSEIWEQDNVPAEEPEENIATQEVETVEELEKDIAEQEIETAEEPEENIATQEVETAEEPEKDIPAQEVETVKEAEEAVSQPAEETVLSQAIGKIPTVPVLDLSFETHSQKDLSAKVEILSGAEWEQPEKTDVEENAVLENDTPENKQNVQNEEVKSTETVDINAETTDINAEIADINSENLETADAETVESNAETENSVDKGEENSEPAQTTETGESASGDEGQPEGEDISIETKVTLTEEELSAFKNYLNVEGFENNIREVLQDLIVNYEPNGKSSDGNVIIMGAEKTGKTTLAIEMIKLANKKRGRRDRRVAKIDAKALNRRGFRNSLNKLLGCDLIVENAQELGVMTLSEVVDVSGMFTDDMLIILEGETEGMEKILSESPRISTVFNHIVRIKEYDIKEWVEYGINFAKKQGYTVDELAKLAFYKTVDDFFGANNGIGQSDVEDIVNQAISKSQRIGRKLSGIFSSKKDEEGLNILMESDFNI